MTRVRLAELVALLSLGTDLGLGQPMEHMIRACLIALRLADRLQLGDADRRVLYYSGLLAWVGCHTDAYEQARWLGEDIESKRDAHYAYDFGRPADVLSFMTKYVGGAGRPLLERLKVGITFFGDGRRAVQSFAENHYRATDELAAQLGLGEDVRASLKESFERWDGKGAFGMKGATTQITSRLVNLADVVEVFRRTAGIDAAITIARARRGTQFDPTLVDLFCEEAPAIFRDLDEATTWDAILAAEPTLGDAVDDEKLDAALEAIGQFADLKSPWRIGHARAVADLVVAAAASYGLPIDEVPTLRRAALVQDIGHLGVSNAIWDKETALTASEIERVRLHPYLSERMLAFSEGLAPLAKIAGQHHERLDGSGYPKGLAGNAIMPAARLLAAADVYHALIHARPHRSAHSPEAAARLLGAEVTANRIDSDAAAAVLRAAGHRVKGRREWPAGLTAREVEVLRLLTRGLSNKEIAARLVVSPKTASNHVEHIYVKISATNRAMASLFAAKHGLMRDD